MVMDISKTPAVHLICGPIYRRYHRKKELFVIICTISLTGFNGIYLFSPISDIIKQLYFKGGFFFFLEI